MELVLLTFIFVLGACIGSFVNAVVWRLRTGEDFVASRSYCVKCRHILAPLDLIPILSYLGLRGRCRYCEARFSIQYLLAEIAVGTMFVLAALSIAPHDLMAYWSGQDLARLVFYWIMIAGLTLVFIYDLRYMLILRRVTVPFTVIAVLGNLLLGADPLSLVIGAVVGFGFFWLQMVLSKGRWIGGGDLHLGLLMGVLLGWPLVGIALWLAYVVGAVIAVLIMARGKAGWKTQIPFGTFLSVAAIFTMLFGERLLNWYMGLL